MNEAALMDMQLAEWISAARTVFVLTFILGVSCWVTYYLFKDEDDSD